MADEEADPVETAATLMSFFGGIMVFMVLLAMLDGKPPPRGMSDAQRVGISLTGGLLVVCGRLTKRCVFAAMVAGTLAFAGWIVYGVVFGLQRVSLPFSLLIPVGAAMPVYLWLQLFVKAVRVAWRRRSNIQP